jgi:3-phenylpropionate/trans-cinnamate dioxygenase ferredoxin reductase component
VSDLVVVVGNGVSGYACAARLAERGVPVMMIGPGLPHDRPPLSKRALVTGRVPLLADAAQLAERGIELFDGVVTTCDLHRRRLVVSRSAGGASLEIEAPTLVWATGLRYPRPPVPGFEQAEENATGAGLMSLVRHLALPHRRVVVVGAGLIGTETAATLAATHDVTLLDMLDRPLARFLPRVSDAARAALGGLGVRFLGSCKIDSASTDADGPVVHTSTHGDIRCDVIISAAGFRSSLPAELAAPDARTLSLPADERLRVIGHERLWACGDCVSFPHPRWGRIGIPHWDHALWSGRHVAESILGSTAPYVREPYFFSDIGPLRIQQVGFVQAAVEWHEDDGLVLGRDLGGAPACVLLLNEPTRLREARELVASAASQ